MATNKSTDKRSPKKATQFVLKHIGNGNLRFCHTFYSFNAHSDRQSSGLFHDKNSKMHCPTQIVSVRNVYALWFWRRRRRRRTISCV